MQAMNVSIMDNFTGKQTSNSDVVIRHIPHHFSNCNLASEQLLNCFNLSACLFL